MEHCMSTALIFDILLGAIFLFCVYTGAKNGFVRAVASLVATVISLVIALTVTSHFAKPLSDRLFVPGLTQFFEDRIADGMMGAGLESMDTLLSISDKLIEGAEGIFHLGITENSEDDGGAADAAQEDMAQSLQGGEASDDSTQDADGEAVAASATLGLSQTVASAFGNAFSSFIMFFIVFALVLAVLRVLIDQLRVLDRIPIVGTVNMLLGLGLGAATGLFFLFVPVWLVLSFIPSVFHADNLIPPELLQESYILNFIAGIYQGMGAAKSI